ncbi:hypothetical protein ACHAWF_019009 [Thalassiosira exigua]
MVLSDRQIQALTHEINEDVNVPFVSEAKEAEIIEEYIRALNPHVGPALEATIGEVYAGAVRKALDDASSLDDRREEISASLRGELSVPLADAVNEHFDAPWLTEEMERDLLKFAMDKILSQFVKWVVGEIDELVAESLAEAAEEAEEDEEEYEEWSEEEEEEEERTESARSISLPPIEGDLLSEREVRAMVIEINKDVDLPFVGERKEGEMIEKFVRKINPRLGPALEDICGAVYAKAVNIMLDEDTPLPKRRKEIAKLLRRELSKPMARELNERVDFDLLPESWEGKALKIVVDKLIAGSVKLIVCEIDERIEESLTKAEG